MFTVDANMFVSASSLADVFHADSDRFLSRVRHSGLRLYCPSLVVPETASAIVQPTGDINAAQLTIASVDSFPGMHLVPLTEQQARAAAHVALICRLRGADAIYVAVAQEYGTTLITWDLEMLARGALAVPAMTPTDWLAANPTI